MRISLTRTKRLADAWRGHGKPSRPTCSGSPAERAEGTYGGRSVEDWARYGGGLVPIDHAGRFVSDGPSRNGVRPR